MNFVRGENVKKNTKELELAILIIILVILLDTLYLLKVINIVYFAYFMASLMIVSLLGTIFTYMDERKRKEKKQIEDLMYYDKVTNLPNKTKFLEDLNFIKNQGKYCVVSLEVKNFKQFLDVFGITETNKFLKFMANSLKLNVENDELIAYINEDEFALALKYDSNDVLEKRLTKINNKIVESSKSIKVVLSFGIYVITDRRFSSSIMLNKANVARKKISDNYNVLCSFYDDNMKSENIELSDIENYMEESLKHKDFIVYYQPKYNVSKNKIIGLEALIRWIHPKRGILSPDSFIGVFEKNNFILKLDMYVLEEVCKTISKWKKNGIKIVPISVNLSRCDLEKNNLISDIQKIVKKYSIEPKYIEFEFTESIIYDNMNKFLNVINVLHQIGYVVSIDDFGAGHSSLNILKNLPVDTLKIDKEFLSEDSSKGKIIIANTITLAKDLNMKVLVEGVESKKQVSFLKKINCDYAQGYYYNKPLSIKEIENVLKK